MLSTQLKNQHLLWRAGFGPAAHDIEILPKRRTNKLYTSIQTLSAPAPKGIAVTTNSLKELYTGYKSAGNKNMSADSASATTNKKLREMSRENLKALSLSWMNEMITSGA